MRTPHPSAQPDIAFSSRELCSLRIYSGDCPLADAPVHGTPHTVGPPSPRRRTLRLSSGEFIRSRRRIEWNSSEGHLQGFRRSPEFGAFFAAVRPYVGHIQEMRHYELTAVRGRSQAAAA